MAISVIGMVSTFTQVIPSDSSSCTFFRFGAEKVLLASGLIWGLLTFWFQKIVHVTAPDLKLVVFTRILIGAAQGVHFPALVSLSRRKKPIKAIHFCNTNKMFISGQYFIQKSEYQR